MTAFELRGSIGVDRVNGGGGESGSSFREQRGEMCDPIYEPIYEPIPDRSAK